MLVLPEKRKAGASWCVSGDPAVPTASEAVASAFIGPVVKAGLVVE